ncbi:MAG: ABC transporter ATP-binding protein/permease [Clostridia bacterium]|nr:ABC transporter ATP-binding protein/permease [Clostridia bacterium]
MLELNNIVKNYYVGDEVVEALKGVSIKFRESEFVSILGPSGCGKTTLLNIIGGLDKYTSGDLIINGVSTKNYKDKDWDTYRNHSIGFVFQSYNLIPHQTVVENVELALTLSGVSKTERKKLAVAALEKVGLGEKINARPNQLSGGQMQRVAIARALINNPDIILADEPTGALDTKTSRQIMDLLKEISKDKLIIMVTHNPELAKQYSSRIIEVLDGKVVGDSMPYEPEEKQKVQADKKQKKSMSFFTALSLSLKNLLTKKARTILTAFAGSIGIIGIALILALSTGFTAYVNKLQADTLSVYPVTVSEATIDISNFEKLLEDTGLDKYPKVKEVYTRKMFESLTSMLSQNNISEEYQAFVKEYADKENEKAAKKDSWKYCVQKSYGFDVNDFLFSELTYPSAVEGETMKTVSSIDFLVTRIKAMFKSLETTGITTDFVRSYIPTLTEMPDSQDLLDSQYDLLAGKWAKNEDELVLVVDSKNQVSDITLALLGIRSIESIDVMNKKVVFGDQDTFTFDEIIGNEEKGIKGKEFYYLKNDDRYAKADDTTFQEGFFSNEIGDDNVSKLIFTKFPENKAMTLKITGIVRIREDVESGVLSNGIAYTSKFVERILADNMDSEVVAAAKENNGSVTTKFNDAVTAYAKIEPETLSTAQLGGSDKVTKLSFYSVDYKSKEELKDYLDTWNEKDGMEEKDKVHYSDQTEMLFSALNTTINAVKIVLIAFTSISLVVSSIMIGIITYISVLERIKEIGILRAIGASKLDVSRVFNAETLIIGFASGMIGIILTYILTIPTNLIVKSLAGVATVASLPILSALILVLISMTLTFISGLIPARIAAKKDPVEALRSD